MRKGSAHTCARAEQRGKIFKASVRGEEYFLVYFDRRSHVVVVTLKHYFQRAPSPFPPFDSLVLNIAWRKQPKYSDATKEEGLIPLLSLCSLRPKRTLKPINKRIKWTSNYDSISMKVAQNTCQYIEIRILFPTFIHFDRVLSLLPTWKLLHGNLHSL
jgi:hypothetical protein